MLIKQGNLIGDVLDKMPVSVTRHLTYLQCGKLALSKAIFKNSGDDAWCGANDVAMEILYQITDHPTKMNKSLDKIFLSKSLFEPQKVTLDPFKSMVYQAALNTAEIQMRRLYDSDQED
jgi:hypothetical protein